jgi:hypothetical protein
MKVNQDIQYIMFIVFLIGATTTSKGGTYQSKTRSKT